MGDNNFTEGNKMRCNGKRGEVIRCAARGGEEERSEAKPLGVAGKYASSVGRWGRDLSESEGDVTSREGGEAM